MDFGRIRSIALAFTILAVVCLVCGLLIYLEGGVGVGVGLMIIGVSVGVISATYLRMISLIYNPWLATNRKYKKRKSHHRGADVFPEPPERPRIDIQYLLLSAGWCFLKQSLQ